jgi:hypothetical protein
MISTQILDVTHNVTSDLTLHISRKVFAPERDAVLHCSAHARSTVERFTVDVPSNTVLVLVEAMC